MRLHRFIGDFDFSKKPLRITDEELLNQWKNVLRLKTGDQVVLADGKENEAVVEIKHLNKNFAELEIAAVTKNEKEPATEVYLYCAILKKENFELVVQKATEAGVAEIIPIITQHIVKLNLNRDRLHKIAKEAAEQSGRAIVPMIHKTLTYEEAIKHAKEFGVPFFFQPGSPLFDPARFRNSGEKNAAVFIGPEGGWDEEEVKMAQLYDLKIVSLGGLTLRSETAAIVATWTVANA